MKTKTPLTVVPTFRPSPTERPRIGAVPGGASEGEDITNALFEARLAGVEEHRNLDCPSYDGCLDVAVRADWLDWTCKACPGYTLRKEKP